MKEWSDIYKEELDQYKQKVSDVKNRINEKPVEWMFLLWIMRLTLDDRFLTTTSVVYEDCFVFICFSFLSSISSFSCC